jgi:hypothetical protein
MLPKLRKTRTHKNPAGFQVAQALKQIDPEAAAKAGVK